jgi:hypothetical protein
LKEFENISPFQLSSWINEGWATIVFEIIFIMIQTSTFLGICLDAYKDLRKNRLNNGEPEIKLE